MTKRNQANEIPSQELFLHFSVCLPYKMEHINHEAMRITNMEKRYRSLKERKIWHMVNMIKQNLF